MNNPDPTAEVPPSITARILRALWQRRRPIMAALARAGRGARWLWRKLPLPHILRAGLREAFFSAVEYGIVRRESYQRWRAGQMGASRFHAWLTPSPEHHTRPHALPTMPSPEAWDELAEKRRARAGNEPEPLVDVIVPVYKGYEETLACLYRVLTSRNSTAFDLVVINDASPDVKLSARLRALQQQGLFNLFEHESNQGFVGSVNHGMQRHESRDVVLLNADCEVFGNWLDRLRDAAYSEAQIATVTPLASNGGIASYPYFLGAFKTGFEQDDAAIDTLAATANAGLRTEVPTAVGYCMYIKRSALAQVGLFDAEAFGRGYGEENDFCLRAAAKGWRHVVTGDVWVRHKGSVSFGIEKRLLMRKGLRVLNRRYPHFREQVRHFKQSDPLRPLRARLDLARLRASGSGHGVLMISHNAGGGTEQHVRELAHLLAAEGITAYRLSPAQSPGLMQLWHPQVGDTPNLTFSIDEPRARLHEWLQQLGIIHLHVHHLLGFEQRMIDWIPLMAQELGIEYDVTLHDYYMLCPSINLIYDSGVFDGEPTLAQSEAWAREHPTPAGATPAWQWQARHGQFLLGARRIFTPSEDTAARFQRAFPGLDIYPRPHPESESPLRLPFIAREAGEPLRIAIIGALARHKGEALVLAMAQDASARNLPIEFFIAGEVSQQRAFARLKNVVVHGRYREGEVYELLRGWRCHSALFASVWPETYSYTLSIAFNAHLFPIAFDLGAQAERILAAGWGAVLPRALMTDPAQLNEHLLSLEISPPPVQLSAASLQRPYERLMRDYYALTKLRRAA